jgi:hypothetical protein
MPRKEFQGVGRVDHCVGSLKPVLHRAPDTVDRKERNVGAMSDVDAWHCSEVPWSPFI